MARMPFDPKHKAEQLGDFPKLKLQHGEKARILCIEDPEFAWVHTLKMPAVVDGKPVMQKVTTRKDEVIEKMKMDFVGRPLCLGDFGVLEEKGVDVKNCPACAKSADSDIVLPPERRFAMHVIQYATKPGSFELRTPFSCSCVVWAFNDTIYNKLTDFTVQWGSLTNHDLFLGPCENVDFQKFEIAISNSAAWQTDENNKKFVLETYNENQTEHLEAFCGRKVTKAFMEEDIQKIVNRWRTVNGESLYRNDDGTGLVDQQSLQEGLSNLLSSTPSVEASVPPASGSGGGLGFGDLFSGTTPSAPAATPPAAAPVETAAPAAPTTPVAASSPVDVTSQLLAAAPSAPAQSAPVETVAPAAPAEAAPATSAPAGETPQAATTELSFDELIKLSSQK